MSFLPQNTELGMFTLVEVYIYYDRPCLFSCRNTEGQFFLALWIDETPESDRWLYTPVSKTVLNIIQSSDFDFRSVFQNASEGYVFDVEVFYDGRSSRVSKLNCSDLSDDVLPV